MGSARALILFSAVAALIGPVAAQECADWEQSEHRFGAGGVPARDRIPVSASFTLEPASVGGITLDTGLLSPSWRLDVTFAGAYAPPGEVAGLAFRDGVTLGWMPERSAGTYSIYRGAIDLLDGQDYGTCWRADVTTTATIDTDVPGSPGAGYSYLVAAVNRLDEEGTRGFASNAVERGADACP